MHRMYSRKQSEPDRLDEINEELRTLTFNNHISDQGDESFEQIASMVAEDDKVNADSISSMPDRFLDAAKMEEVFGDSFEVGASDEEAGDVSAEWIGNVYASE